MRMIEDPREAGTRIVATLGPASFDLAVALVEAGAMAIRLNGSHMTPGELEDVLQRVRAALPSLPVVVDLQGAKMRLGKFKEIVDQVDELWICRGDLGSQLGPIELARWVGGFRPRGLQVPVLMAGQVLEHLTSHSEPTRSEICHLYDLGRRGYAGIVLSDETAIGADPVGALSQARVLLRAFGRDFSDC